MLKRLIRCQLPAAGLLLALALPAAGTPETQRIDWSDTSRDVYLDGELEPGAIVLSTAATDQAGRRIAILSTRAQRAFIVDLESLEVGKRPLAHFDLTATGASSEVSAEKLAAGRATRVRGHSSTHYLATAGNHTLLIAPHQGHAGQIQLDELYETAPTWQRRAGAYTPDPAAVAVLAAHQEPVDVTVAFGTWCGDSRNYVPKVLSALDAAANPNLRLQLVAIGRGFGEPAEHIFGQRLTNVPTVIVRHAGDELGRIVETPATDTIEADLAAILQRAPETHRGRWSREAEIAHGRYAYRDAENRELGGETWELFGTEDGGRLLHCTMTRDGSAVAPEGGLETLDIWHRRDAEGASEFVELTRTHEGEHSRTRIWIDEGELNAVTRGNLTGIVEQTLEVPSGTNFALPCVADAGYNWLRLDRPVQDTSISTFELAADRPAAGKLVEVRTSSTGRETVTASHGEIDALRLASSSGGVTSKWWLDGELGVPVRGMIDGLGQVMLEELTVAQVDTVTQIDTVAQIDTVTQ